MTASARAESNNCPNADRQQQNFLYIIAVCASLDFCNTRLATLMDAELVSI